MSEHDPLCPEYPSPHTDWTCQCDLIAKVRAEEQAKRTAADTNSGHFVRSLMLADLRAEVATLRDVVTPNVDFFYQKGRTLAFQQVLRLIDGGIDG